MMRIQNSQSTISFWGIKTPYRRNGITVYPIERDITQDEINRVRECITADRLIGQGLNGKVYRLNDNYVVKVPVPNRIVKDSILNETKKLDMLYDFSKERKVDLQNSQRGIVSFFTDRGEEYLISTLVKGSQCNKNNNKLNKYNIDSVMKILTEMDIGSEKYGRIMSYDYNGGNVNFTKKGAGILDFEYMRGIPLEFDISDRILNGRRSISPHLSDTSALTSNVRTFEFGNLYNYLMALTPRKAEKLFKLYLDRKSLYHTQMSDFYALKSKQGNNYKDVYRELATREKNHSNLLNKKNITADIIKSEAIKIQMAEFMYRVCGSKLRGNYNPNQVFDYYEDAVKYFKDQFRKNRKACNYDLASYYYDCMKTMRTWKDIKNIVFYGFDKSRFLNTEEKTLDVVVKTHSKRFSILLSRFLR